MKKVFFKLLFVFLSLSLVFSSCSDDDVTPDPVISSIAPENAGEGTTVTITGNYFSTDTSAIVVTIGGIESEIVSASETSISFVVPKGAILGESSVVVSIGGRETESTQKFTIVKNPFTITSLSKKTGKAKSKIKIYGTNLNATDFKVEMNNGSGKNVKQKIVSAAEDGSYIEIELASKTFSGKFEITRISDDVIFKSPSFTYEITYSEPEIMLTSSASFFDVFVSNDKNIYVIEYQSATIKKYNSAFEFVENINISGTFAENFSFSDILVRENGDIILFVRDFDVILRFRNEVVDTLCFIPASDYSLKFSESKEGILYISSQEAGKMYRLDLNISGQDPVNIANIDFVDHFCFDLEGNIITNNLQTSISHKIDINNNYEISEYADFSPEYPGVLSGVCIHPVQNEIIYAGYENNKILQRLTESTCKVLFENTTIVSPRTIKFDGNNDLIIMTSEYVYKSIAN
ncbi:MAG: IPT/TIG domain-containing protein [Bacteroidales bacterium]|nr:IPT/TIG domain-containing protein [Bacteroidales bacterium]